MRTFTYLSILMLCLSGCAEGSSIYHLRALKVGQPSIITTDAKQRSILFDTRSDGIRVCAEAAPDVFSAISAAGALEADAKTQSGKAGFSFAETAGTLERTQTINLLRESMYRTCERYLNGGIGKAELVVQAARDQRAMVRVLAIEQLTRTARPPATIISGAPLSASLTNGDTVASLITDFSKDRKDAKALLDAADGDYGKAKKVGKCDAVVTAPADDSGDPTLTEWSACKAAEATRVARQNDFDEANTRLDKALAVAGQLNSGVLAAVQGGPVSTGAGGGGLDSAAMQSIAAAVQQIATLPDIDEALMFCVSVLGPVKPGEPSVDASIIQSCRGIVERRADLDNQIRAASFQTINFGTAIKRPELLSLNTYLTRPAGTGPNERAERQRRIALLIKAAQSVGITLPKKDVPTFVTTANAAVAAAVGKALLALETDMSAAADLKN